MSLQPGTRLGPYEVTALIGQGGMGEVYRARDTKLGRDVALKVLPDLFADDPERLARFQREARVLASLNHPNIASIYGLEESGDTRALVLELVEGPTLAERIAQGAIPLDEALPIAKQIAEALEAAHEKGVIHRDLKPANVKVKADGMVKVLDFGLAKALEGDAGSDPSESPTMTAAATRAGVIMGTAAYMSPEQARGKTVDKRADIWAFGVVLYEMLTGRRAFEGEDVSLTMAAVMKSDPDWDALPAAISPAIEAYLRRCLHKDPTERVRDIGDARLAISGAFEIRGSPTSSSISAAAQTSASRRILPMMAAAVVASAVTGGVVWNLTSNDTALTAPTRRFVIDLPATGVLRGNTVQTLEISADGRAVILNVTTQESGQFQSQLFLRPLESLETVPIRGTENAGSFLVSPDGEWVAFNDPADATFKKVPLAGGPPATISETGLAGGVGFQGASWGDGGTIVFATTAYTGLMRVPDVGGIPEPLTTPAEESQEVHQHPHFLPGSEALLFVIGHPGQPNRIAALWLETGQYETLMTGSWPHYVAGGRLVFLREDALWAVAFDSTQLAVTGEPVPVLEGVQVPNRFFALSRDGTLVFAPRSEAAGAPRTLVWVDRDGQEQSLGVEPQPYIYPRISPEGDRLAVAVAEDVADPLTDADLWVFDLDRGSRSRITFGGNNRFFPVWMPAGDQLTFSDGPTAPNTLRLASADGSGRISTLLEREGLQYPTSWSSDGRALAYYENHPETLRDLWVLPVEGDPEPVLVTPFQERAPAFSPDGRWLAYVSDKSGQDEIYVQPYPGPGQEFTVSTAGGREPLWSPDGSELFYRSEDQLMVVAVDLRDTFRGETPRPLLADPYERDPIPGAARGVPNYDIARDGQRFVMVRRDTSGGLNAVVVVLNWFEELKARVPVP